MIINDEAGCASAVVWRIMAVIVMASVHGLFGISFWWQVMTLERISMMGKVFTQLSPAMSPENIDAAVKAMRQRLVGGALQRCDTAQVSTVASISVTPESC